MKTAVVCVTLFVACLFLEAATSTHREDQPTSSLRNLLRKDLHSVNGGTTCAACSILVGLVEQLTQIYNISVADAIDKFCNFLPSGFKEACNIIVVDFAPSIIKLLEDKETPDVVCHAIDLCKNQNGQVCHAFPLPNNSMDEIKVRISKARRVAQLAAVESNSKLLHPYYKLSGICDVSIIKPICELIDRFGKEHLPVDDIDKDYFSDLPTFRGSSWRGKDCSDVSPKVYPGRHTVDDAIEDTNCNGIFGTDPDTGRTYESLWCNGSRPMGSILLGDSAGAHFHIPPAWMTSRDLSVEVFKDLFFVLENELDWPMMSSATGYTNSTWPLLISGPVRSSYLKLREINRCNHRDFQSIAVNGARAQAMASELVKGFARHGKLDNPVFLSLALIGNDVCNGHHDMSHMTTPEEFYNSTLTTLRYVDSIVAPGSIVIGVGLVDGRILFNTMHDQIHPIGSLNNDVTYAQIYDYLNCLEVSPCFGWLNSNETWRNLTSERAFQLNDAFEKLVATETFTNFKAYYFDPPIAEVFQRWVKQGGKPKDIIEPVDGFHPSQVGQALNTDVFLEKVEKLGIFPPTNPYNDKIAQKFGDQGGY